METAVTISEEQVQFTQLTKSKSLLLLNYGTAMLLYAWYLLPALKQVGRSPMFACLLTLWMASSILLDRSWISRRSIGFLLSLLMAWVVVYFANFILGRTSMFFEYIYVSFVFFAPALLYTYYKSTYQYRALRSFSYIILLLVIITALTTLIGQYLYPGSARLLSTGLVKYGIEAYSAKNIGGYGFSYALMLYTIVFASHAFHLKPLKQKFLSLVILLLFTLVILKTEFTLCILCFFIGLFLLICANKKRALIIFLLLTLFCLLFLLFSTDLFYLISSIMKKVSSLTIKTRFQEIISLLQSGTVNGDLGMRLDRYFISINTILSHPIFGVGGYYGYNTAEYGIGGHAELWDLFARFGIIGALPILVIFTNQFLINRKQYQKSCLKHAVIVSQLILAFLSITNTFFTSSEIGFIIFFAIPSILYAEHYES